MSLFFNEGDVVTVRRDLAPGRVYYMDGHSKFTDAVGSMRYSDSAVSQMVTYAGKKVTIHLAGPNVTKYHIREEAYNWTDEMFEEYINKDDADVDTSIDLLSVFSQW